MVSAMTSYSSDITAHFLFLGNFRLKAISHQFPVGAWLFWGRVGVGKGFLQLISNTKVLLRAN